MSDMQTGREIARAEARAYGAKLQVNPYSALLNEVQWRAGHVEYLRNLIQSQAGVDGMGLFVFDSFGNQVDSPVLRRYDKERDKLDRVCKLAIDAGIAERYVQLAELHGQALFGVLQTAFNDPAVGLTDEQRAAMGPALRRALAAQEQRVVLEATSQ